MYKCESGRKLIKIYNMAKLNRINLPHGGISLLAEKFGIDRNTVSKYLAGFVDEFSQNYDLALKVREEAKTRFNIKA